MSHAARNLLRLRACAELAEQEGRYLAPWVWGRLRFDAAHLIGFMA